LRFKLSRLHPITQLETKPTYSQGVRSITGFSLQAPNYELYSPQVALSSSSQVSLLCLCLSVDRETPGSYLQDMEITGHLTWVSYNIHPIQLGSLDSLNNSFSPYLSRDTRFFFCWLYDLEVV
jgi:hypothetical protein